MQKKKENLIDKIVKKDFNEELEKVLELKSFPENVQSILLSILYKIEAGYSDLKLVKQDIETKEEYIEKYIVNIYDNINSIKLIKVNDKESDISENGTFYINKEEKEIQVYPIERKVLYAIYKISKKDKIITNKYYLIDEVLSDLLTVGNTIQKVEPLRDFNGYSWLIMENEIESVNHNLIYQSLRMLIGNKFLENWVDEKEQMLDYYEEFIVLLEEKYGEELSKKLKHELIKIAILLERIYNNNKLMEYEKDNIKLKVEVDKMKDMAKYVAEISENKINIAEKIGKIDEILNDKDKLQEEYFRRNEGLPLEKKIFSMRILGNILKEDKRKLYQKLEKLNDLSNPKKFLKHKEELQSKIDVLSILDVKNIEKELKESIKKFQEYFLECFKINIKKAETKQQIISLIYEYRYYRLIPKEVKINDKETIIELLKKANQLKAIVKISENIEYQYEILKNIFNTRAIKLENLSLKITKEKEKIFMQLFDEKMFEDKVEVFNGIEVNKKELEIKLNKKIKIFE